MAGAGRGIGKCLVQRVGREIFGGDHIEMAWLDAVAQRGCSKCEGKEVWLERPETENLERAREAQGGRSQRAHAFAPLQLLLRIRNQKHGASEGANSGQ